MNPRGFLSCEKAERIDPFSLPAKSPGEAIAIPTRLPKICCGLPEICCDRRLLAASGGGFS
jgi:hypothetical protein